LNEQLDTAGPYAINLSNYKEAGFKTKTIYILSDYLKKIGVTI
jgi:hypothetical protein